MLERNVVAQAIAQNGGQVTGASFVALPSSGTPNGTGASALAGFPTDGADFGILTTGNVSFADDANSSGSTGVNLGGGNVRGNTDFDVTVLRIDLDVPVGANCLSIDFRFLSDEYPEYVNSIYNDAFIAELDTSTWTTSGSTITAPNNFTFDPSNNVISINAAGVTSMSAANAAGTTYDGATPLLTASTPITSGAHSLYLSIFDQGDHAFDSAVFLDRLVLGTTAQGGCQPGATVLSTTKTADASSVGSSGSDGYTITVSNPGNTAVTLTTITDSLPAGFSYVPGSTTGATTNDPGIVGQDLTWTGPFPLAALGTVTLHFDVAAATAVGTYDNNAGATSDDASVSPTGPTAPVTVLGCGDNAVNQPGEVCDGTDDSACPESCQADCTCPAGPICGDDVVNQTSEQCDGTADSACPGLCTNDCTCAAAPVCGDNTVNQTTEQCDGTADAACPGACQLDCTCATCGDNAVNQGTEQCDGTSDTACPGACKADCTCPTCGDDTVNQGTEQCDGTADTACPGRCQTDCTCTPICGDNAVNQPAEVCDGTDDSACPGRCIAAGDTGACTCSLCGNGTLDPGETCDDGNQVTGCRTDLPQKPKDSCNNDCKRPACKDPTRIDFRTGLGFIRFHARIATDPLNPVLDASGKTVTLRLRSPSAYGGVVFEASIRSGLEGANGRFTYRDRTARKSGGIETIEIRPRGHDSFAVKVEAWGDLSKATTDMTTGIIIGGEEWSALPVWRRTAHGLRALQ